MNNFCGLDFGTSNSAMGYFDGSSIKLTQFGAKPYIPSSIFFEFDEKAPHFGEQAKKRYIDGAEGRMIWSPKNALGTSLIFEKTQIEDKRLSFTDIIGLIVKNVKNQCEEEAKREMTSIVVGRPVHYNDKDKNLDDNAQKAMAEILQKVGFKEIAFEYEPIAAAAHYEQTLAQEEIALVVDMGGGTSDFTIAQLGAAQKYDKNKILSIGGIHIAGTNFDKRLSLASLMPELGLHSQYKSLEGKWLPVPPTLHNDLATWHKIGFCYNKKNIQFAKSMVYCSDEPHKFERLLQALQKRLGHNFALAIEDAKIDLSEQENHLLRITEVNPLIETMITQKDFQEAINSDVESILNCLKNTVADAQIKSSDVKTIFMTGGATLVPLVRNKILSSLPQARLIDGDKFGSVAMGLTLLAQKKFESGE